MLLGLYPCVLILSWHLSHFFHKNFFGFHYFYFTQSVFVSVVYPNHTEYMEVTGHFAILTACYLRSPQLSTFLPKLHHGFTANISNYIIPMKIFHNLNFSSIKYVTNTLSEFKFSNNSGLETAQSSSSLSFHHCSCVSDHCCIGSFDFFVSGKP